MSSVILFLSDNNKSAEKTNPPFYIMCNINVGMSV